MKPAERRRIAGILGNTGSGLQVRGRMLLVVPMGRILRGLYIEDSSDPHRIYLWAFVQPLFVPSTGLVLSLGKRLGSPSRTWSVADVEAAAATIVNEGMGLFGSVSTPAALASWELLEGRKDEYSREARAYALVASGSYLEGARALRAFSRSLPPAGPDWMLVMGKRAEELARSAENEGQAAQELLMGWELETKASLRITDVA